MKTRLRRLLLAALGLLAVAAIAWRVTLGTPEALGDLAEQRREAARADDVERTLRAERDVANATGPQGYGNVIRLIDRCHDAVRDALRRHDRVELDSGMLPERSHVYVQRFRDRRVVGLMASAPRDGSDDAREYPALLPPLAGEYDVNGLVRYDGTQQQLYQCTARVRGEALDVLGVEFRAVR